MNSPDLAQQIEDLLTKEKQGGRLTSCRLIAHLIRPMILQREQDVVQAALAAGANRIRHTGSKKEREVLFDALCGACGIPRDNMTTPMKKTVAVALSTILAVMPALTAQEIELRARQYRRKHPTWELTPSSLAKHWGSLATAESLQGKFDEPQGWRGRVGVIFPEDECGATGEVIAKQFWPQIGRPHQERICRIMNQLTQSPP